MRPSRSLLVLGLSSCVAAPVPFCSFAASAGLRTFQVERLDATLYGETTGQGPPLVLIHGGADHRIFHPVMHRLADEFTVVFYDQRGYGRTEVSEGAEPTTLRTDVADVDAIREHFGWEAIHLLAYSHGGPVAIEYARTRPVQTRKVVLLDTYADNEARLVLAQPLVRDAIYDLGRERQLKLLESIENLTSEERAIREFLVVPHVFHENPLPREAVEFWLRSGCIGSGDARHRSGRGRTLLDELGEVEAETLVICGEKDRITPLPHSRDMARRLRNGRLEILAGCGHLSYAEDPEAFLSSMRQFLR